MTRGLKLLLGLVVIAGLYCSGGEKPNASKSTATEKTAAVPAAGAVPANAAAEGFPPEAFAVLTDAEMTKYVKVLPVVGQALKAAGGYSPKSEKASLMGNMASMIEGIKSVKGVDAALKQAGSSWPEFRTTTFKVVTANAAVGVAMASAMAESDSSVTAAEREEIQRAKAFFAGVPKDNQTLVFKYADQLKPLDELDK